jgi:antirestriction protein ArdC
MRKKKKAARAALHETVAMELIRGLEEGGVPPWIAPWSTEGGRPANLTTSRVYRGINILILWSAMRSRGFQERWWCTYRQAIALGGHVRKGERGTPVVFWRPRDPAPDEEPGARPRWLSGSATVFNLEQCDGLPDVHKEAVDVVTDQRIDKWVEATGIHIRHGGGQAHYTPTEDAIQLPDRTSFSDHGNYYATLMHELVHATAHPSRLDRKQGRFGDDVYAREELIAEMGAAFLCAEFGLPGELQHVAYLDHWIRVLRADPRVLLRTASAAQKATDWLHGGIATTRAVA